MELSMVLGMDEVEHAQIPSSESAHGIQHGDTLLLLVGLPVHAGQRLQPAEYI